MGNISIIGNINYWLCWVTLLIIHFSLDTFSFILPHTELLANYKTKLTEVSKAKEKIKELETELESLAESFDEASKKYKECYKTP